VRRKGPFSVIEDLAIDWKQTRRGTREPREGEMADTLLVRVREGEGQREMGVTRRKANEILRSGREGRKGGVIHRERNMFPGELDTP